MPCHGICRNCIDILSIRGLQQYGWNSFQTVRPHSKARSGLARIAGRPHPSRQAVLGGGPPVVGGRACIRISYPLSFLRARAFWLPGCHFMFPWHALWDGLVFWPDPSVTLQVVKLSIDRGDPTQGQAPLRGSSSRLVSPWGHQCHQSDPEDCR